MREASSSGLDTCEYRCATLPANIIGELNQNLTGNFFPKVKLFWTNIISINVIVAGDYNCEKVFPEIIFKFSNSRLEFRPKKI